MKLYLSGPMTGLPDLNFPAFHAAAAELRAMGYEVVNPAELNPDGATPWAQCMRNDIKALCDCDALVLLPGWEKSQGAHLEVHVAHRLEIDVLTIEKMRAVDEFACSMVGLVKPRPACPALTIESLKGMRPTKEQLRPRVERILEDAIRQAVTRRESRVNINGLTDLNNPEFFEVVLEVAEEIGSREGFKFNKDHIGAEGIFEDFQPRFSYSISWSGV